MDVSIINPIAATPDLQGSSFVRSATSAGSLKLSALREVNIVELGTAIADLGHRVTIVVGSVYVGDRAVPLGANLSVVPVHTLMPFPFHPGVLPMTPALLRHPATRDVDVIQSGEFHQPSTFFAAEASLEHGIPLVLWQETFLPMRFPGSLYQRGFELACGPRVRAAASKCIPRTSKAREYLHALKFKDAAIPHWIPTGIDLTQFAPRPATATSEDFGWRGECDILLLVARLSPSKGVDRALRILKRLRGKRRSARLLVRGSGPQEAELRRLAASLGVSAFVRFVPRLPRAKMVDLYNLAKVVLCTSRADLLPFALLEASACGRPVVAADVGAVADIVEDGRTGSLVPRGDEEALGHAVEGLLQDEERRLRFGRAARARAEACFDVRATAKHLVEVYRATAG
ncbi:MAG TPA: glycosyltransferase family 4 protein [Thermoplasmata archaeon]|nr:glycosyltransferase family 4 protein [Thermoplasmata archaeon]